ncbi:MAG TPA: FAD-dependent oxidoreductase [Anaerolineae bacterium]|nr:FAD-dependent oxidoreductase [Anaerolineae bacterium]
MSISQTEKPPVGAVMVVGGGIAGMQASLDLAEQGFKVYLVEKQSAIGGKMAQLDKTFPTNDCAMCTISPKLVETGRHPNITVMTNTEVLDVKGRAGDFSVRIRRNPRYVDLDKCIGCGDCAKVCPVIVPDTFNEGLASRRAAYKLYPQAVPNAYAIEKRGIAPCRDACPAGQRAQGYIALIREGRWHDALRVIKMDNPFPGICGRICNHRCETACNRGLVDEPINIRALKRFVTDKVYAEPRKPVQPVPRLHEARVAIIGAGPCGLTAAQDLVMAGYGVTVFEAMPVAGGMLRLGVPDYRLPAEIIEREAQDIVDLGVDLRLNHRVDNLDDIFDEGFDAVLIAVGAHEGIRLPIPGANLDGVLINTHFLRDVRLGRYKDEGGTPATRGQVMKDEDSSLIPHAKRSSLGQRVLVLGGGNVAIDVARSAVRLGREVHMACLESGETIPAHPWEVEAAKEEGVVIHEGRTFERIVGDENGRVAGVECQHAASFSFDEMGRLSVEKVPNSTHVIPCDTVIFSVGQRAGLAFIPEDAGVGLTARKMIAVNPNTLAATREGVFAAGDSVSGTAFVIEAVDSGHVAARSIIRYLQREQLEPPPKPELPVVRLSREEIDARIVRGQIRRQPRVPLPELPVALRIDNFAEVEGGYDDESAQREAARCLACGICSECMSCTFACGRDAINHDDVERFEDVGVGAIVLAPGYQIYNAHLSEEYGLGRYPNVVTSLQYERMLSASGPTKGHVQRPADGASPKRIAFLQCVGSRDQSHDYCSSVCCMYAAKEAIMTVEHARAEARAGNGNGDVTCQVFFMDTRAFSKGYEEYYRRAEKKYGVKYTRCRVSAVHEDPRTHNLVIRYAASDQSSVISNQSPVISNQSSVVSDQSVENRLITDHCSLITDHCSLITDHWSLITEEFDLVVLSVGMEIADSVQRLGHSLGIELDSYGFCHTTLFDPLQTSRPGIYVAGPFREPKDIPETVIDASGAAAAAARLLASARHTLAQAQAYPPERNVLSDEPRIGVFVCHCGTNIGGFLDVPGVAEYARSLPGVVHAEDNLYTCSQDTIAHIIDQVKTLGLNRVVVASCTPLTHEPLFQDAIRHAGLNPHLFEMANIRNQCSWIHSSNWEAATSKAVSLVRMAVARATELKPLKTAEVPVNNAALIVGGGAAGMTAALTLADQGFPVHLVEREGELGGNLRHLRYFVPSRGNGATPTPKEYLAQTVTRVQQHPLIKIYLNTELIDTGGFKGNFTSTLRSHGETFRVQHGATIVATGGVEYKGKEYAYGKDPRIVTQLEFEALLSNLQLQTSKLKLQTPKSAVMIQCVGPGERFCSRLCCTTALKNALKLKELNPKAEVTIIYRDIRTYGFKERLYTEARRAGVRFIHYEFDRKPEVRVGESTNQRISESAMGESANQRLSVRVWEPVLGRELELTPDLLVLSTPVVPSPGARNLATRLKVPVDMDGFFLEAHVKLRPVDFAAEGVFMAGAAHYPKFLDETIAQAQAAASRAANILAQESMLTNARVAVVDPLKCVGCLTCVRICPYDVPKVRSLFTGVGNIVGAAYIEPAICHGCGTCASECPARAIQLMHYTDAQTLIKIDALFSNQFTVTSSQSTVASSRQPQLITDH